MKTTKRSSAVKACMWSSLFTTFFVGAIEDLTKGCTNKGFLALVMAAICAVNVYINLTEE